MIFVDEKETLEGAATATIQQNSLPYTPAIFHIASRPLITAEPYINLQQPLPPAEAPAPPPAKPMVRPH